MSERRVIRPSRLAMAAVVVVGVGACAQIVERPTRAIMSTQPFVSGNTTEELAQKLAAHMKIITPEGPGPFPVVLQFHGCGGLTGPDGVDQPIMDEYAEAAKAIGVATIIVDSFTHREITREQALEQVCTGRRLRGTERAGDVLAALDYVRGLDFVDADRIALAGWSHGGWSVMDLLSMDLENRWPAGLRDVPDDRLHGVEGVYLTYPYAGFLSRTSDVGWRWPLRARFVVAGDDEVAPESSVRTAVAEAFESGATVEVVTFEGATHGFDERYQEPDSNAVFDAELAREARDAYAQWLQDVLVNPPADTAAAELVFLASRFTAEDEAIAEQLRAEADLALGRRSGADAGVRLTAATDAAAQDLSAATMDEAALTSLAETGERYVVRPGDTLSGIAQARLGDAGAYRLVFAANRDVLDDPDVIYPGQVLLVPRPA